jgi:glycerol-3-phosphate dehydrogenase
VPRHRHLCRQAALRLAPALREDALVGAVRYYDAQVDDARHTLMTARTAARYGAALATSARVTGFLRDGERVTGVRVRDLESGRDLEVRGRQVVSATGLWTEELLRQVGGSRYHVRMSKGIHFTVPGDRITSGTGLILRTEKSVLFVIPRPGVRSAAPTTPVLALASGHMGQPWSATVEGWSADANGSEDADRRWEGACRRLGRGRSDDPW